MKKLTRLLLMAAVVAFAQGLAPRTAVSQKLTVVSFNIRYNSWNNIDGKNGWQYRRKAVVKMIEKEKPAAIGLQEALVDQLLYLDSCLPAYRHTGVGRDDGKDGGEFMAIYYDTAQLELIGSKTRRLSETPDEPSKGWDAACFRTVTQVVFRDRESGKKFVYLNTHLDHVGKDARAEGTHLIAALVESECQEMPVIVGGDMNSTIEDPIFEAFFEVGLQPARDMTPESSYKETYTGFGKDKPSLIDHFFVKDMAVASFSTLDGNYGVPYISDHYPIRMVVEL